MTGPVDALLLSVDPVRRLLAVSETLRRASELDGRVREAVALVADRLGGLSATERDETLAPLVWLALRQQFDAETVAAVCRSLGDCAGVLHAVDAALATTLDVEVLQAVVQEAKAADDGRLQEARNELLRARAGDDSPI